VEQTLEGNHDRLKERSLGVEVFGRDADYDTARDPVVRTSAVEIRKRLSQYYEEFGAKSSVRIELPAGSYVPEFHTIVEPSTETEAVPPELAVATPAEPARRPWLWASGAVLIAIAGSGLFYFSQRVTVVDRFWAPLKNANAAVLFGVSGGVTSAPAGGPGANQTMADVLRSSEQPSTEPASPAAARNPSVPLGDVTALVDIAAYLKSAGKPYRIRLSGTLQFDDLKAGPSVLLGPTVRWLNLVTSNWRFQILRDEPVTATWVEDREKPGQRTWALSINPPAPSVAETYAVVTRVWNQTTSQAMVNVAGMSPYATAAAGQFLVDPASMEEVARDAPSGWDRKNIQLVIATKRVGASSGTPRLIARHFW
jgi:hypothetical protein